MPRSSPSTPRSLRIGTRTTSRPRRHGCGSAAMPTPFPESATSASSPPTERAPSGSSSWPVKPSWRSRLITTRLRRRSLSPFRRRSVGRSRRERTSTCGESASRPPARGSSIWPRSAFRTGSTTCRAGSIHCSRCGCSPARRSPPVTTSSPATRSSQSNHSKRVSISSRFGMSAIRGMPTGRTRSRLLRAPS